MQPVVKFEAGEFDSEQEIEKRQQFSVKTRSTDTCLMFHQNLFLDAKLKKSLLPERKIK